MWNAVIEPLNSGRIHKISVLHNTNPLRFAEVLEGWQWDEAFRTFTTRLLADAPFAAYFWEMPALTQASIDRSFECVLVDSPGLVGRTADTDAFAEYFAAAGADEGVVSFPNLGKDAFLIAPCPRGSLAAYPHLAAFVREAPPSQQQTLWQQVGRTVTERLSDRSLWLSTSGAGVYWLHVRLDAYPKYYTFRPYTED